MITVMIMIPMLMPTPGHFPVKNHNAISALRTTAQPFHTIVVNSAADVVADDGQCTLREALRAADTNRASGTLAGECPEGAVGLDYILFRIGSGGPQTITVAPLVTPAMGVAAEPVVIDGTSQPGYSGTPLIRLDGGYLQPTNYGLTLAYNSSGSTIRGLMFTRFTGPALDLRDSNGHVIQNNYFGTDGNIALGNSWTGILIEHSSYNLIGGATWEGNVISGNDVPGSGTCGVGVQITRGVGGNSTGNKIQGNMIGTDPTGSFALPNCIGVEVDDTPNTLIGGSPLKDQGNLISGNTTYGISVVRAGATNIKIQGNRVGTDATGLNPLPNWTGISAAYGGSIQVYENVIAYSSGYGLNLYPNTLVLSGSMNNCMHDNSWGVYNATGGTVSFAYNWWGDPSGPSGAGLGYGDPVSPNVRFRPWLTDPSSVCPF